MFEYTIQPVIKPVVKSVWQLVWQNGCIVYTAGCQTGCTTRFDNRVERTVAVRSTRLSNRVCQTCSFNTVCTMFYQNSQVTNWKTGDSLMIVCAKTMDILPYLLQLFRNIIGPFFDAQCTYETSPFVRKGSFIFSIWHISWYQLISEERITCDT